MRSVRELVRTYVHVNRKEGVRNPVRFGSALAFVVVATIGLWVIAGSGPAAYRPGEGPALSQGDGADGGDAEADADALVLVTRALPGGGVYIGYDAAGYDPSLRDLYDIEEARDQAIAYHLDHVGSTPPEPVLAPDGSMILGFNVR